MQTTKQLAICLRIVDLQADIIDGYKNAIHKAHAEEELELIELEKKINKVSALRDSLGGMP